MIIISKAYIENEFIDESYVAKIELDEADIERYKKLSETVRTAQCYEITSFDSPVELYEGYYDGDTFEGESDPETGEPTERIECCLIHAGHDYFKFTFYLKHTAVKLETERFFYDFLEGKGDVINIPAD
jgi:hypothetical protein